MPAKKKRKVEERTVYLIFHNKKIALRRRPRKGLLAGLWEYPNEIAPWACPVRGKTASATAGKHIFTHIEWHMTAYTVRAPDSALPDGWIWADWDELAGVYTVPSAFAAFEQIVEDELQSGRD